MAITPVKLSPAWIGYQEALEPTRHYVVRLFATKTDATDQLRDDFLVKFAKYAGVEVPLLYKSKPNTVAQRGISLPYAPSSSYVELPVGANETWSFIAQPVDNYVNPVLLNVVANILDPRVVAVLVERAPTGIVTEATLENAEDPDQRETLLGGAFRPYPYDLALLPDRGYTATFWFDTAMPSRLELKKKLAEAGISYIDPGSEIEAQMTTTGKMIVFMATTGHAPTPRDLARLVGAQSVYVDRKYVISADDAMTLGRLGWAEDTATKLEALPREFISGTVKAAEDSGNALKWILLAGVGILGGGLLLKAWEISSKMNRRKG